MDPLVSSMVNLEAARTASSVQYAVAAKILKTEKDSGAAVEKLIAAASQGIDQAAQSVVDATTGALDTYA